MREPRNVPIPAGALLGPEGEARVEGGANRELVVALRQRRRSAEAAGRFGGRQVFVVVALALVVTLGALVLALRLEVARVEVFVVVLKVRVVGFDVRVALVVRMAAAEARLQVGIALDLVEQLDPGLDDRREMTDQLRRYLDEDGGGVGTAPPRPDVHVHCGGPVLMSAFYAEGLCHMPITLTSAQCRAGRALVNWSVRDLAETSAVHRNTISAFESGKTAPNAATLTVLRAALEGAGVVFIAENGGGAGVRLAARS